MSGQKRLACAAATLPSGVPEPRRGVRVQERGRPRCRWRRRRGRSGCPAGRGWCRRTPRGRGRGAARCRGPTRPARRRWRRCRRAATSMAPSAAPKPAPGGAMTSSASTCARRPAPSRRWAGRPTPSCGRRAPWRRPARSRGMAAIRHVARAALGARAAGDEEEVGLAHERDPRLASGHAVAVAVCHGAGGDRGGVRAGVRLGQAEARRAPALRSARRPSGRARRAARSGRRCAATALCMERAKA